MMRGQATKYFPRTAAVNRTEKSEETNFVVVVEQLSCLLLVGVDDGDVIEVSECKQLEKVVGVGAGSQQLCRGLDVAHQDGHVERRHAERRLRVVHRAPANMQVSKKVGSCTNGRSREFLSTTTLQPFYSSLDYVRHNPGEPIPQGTFCQILDFLVQNEDNTGRCTNNPDGLPPTNWCPNLYHPHHFYAGYTS